MNSIMTLIVELNDAVKWRDKAEDIEAADKVLTKNGVRYCGWDGCKEPKYKSGADALLADFSDFECLDWDVIEEVGKSEDNCQA